MTVVLRRATSEDVPFLVRLVADDDIAPYLAAVRAASEDEVAREVARSANEPEAFGVYVIEADGESCGTVSWERVNQRLAHRLGERSRARLSVPRAGNGGRGRRGSNGT